MLALGRLILKDLPDLEPLAHTIPQSQSSTSDNSNWKEKLVAETEQWEMQRAELCASLDLSQDLVREMASALQKVGNTFWSLNT